MIKIKGVRVTQRGWGGHLCCANSCKFRLNTLLEYGKNTKLIVSTVGAWSPRDNGKLEQIGVERHYETMVFAVLQDGEYLEADVSRKIETGLPWSLLCTNENLHTIDNLATAMHEVTVVEMLNKIKFMKPNFE